MSLVPSHLERCRFVVFSQQSWAYLISLIPVWYLSICWETLYFLEDFRIFSLSNFLKFHLEFTYLYLSTPILSNLTMFFQFEALKFSSTQEIFLVLAWTFSAFFFFLIHMYSPANCFKATSLFFILVFLKKFYISEFSQISGNSHESIYF